MKKILLIMISLFLWVTANAAVPNPIKFATEATYPPFESMNSTGKIIGFDMDIANALCQQMKVQCTFSNQPWESLIPSLKLGKFDALIGSMAITETRKQQIDFTDPYLDPTVSFVAAKSAHLILTSAGLKQKSVGLQGGTTFEGYVHNVFGQDVLVKTYPSVQNAFLDLTAGRIDAVLADTPTAISWLKQNNDNKYTLVGKPTNDPKYFGLGDGIAVQKGNIKLLNVFNKALAEIKRNGVYDKIYNKYFANK